MTTNVLVINSGSSSLKYQVVDAESGRASAVGLIERIGSSGGRITHRVGQESRSHDVEVPDHTEAMAQMDRAFAAYGPDLGAAGLVGVGHRVVQGGNRFGGPVLVDDEVEDIIADLATLAPLHNNANLAGIRAARRTYADLPHVVVFDTAFHLTMPEYAGTYALNREVAQRHRIRRYGAHGTSHAYVTRVATEFLGTEPDRTNLIVAHLGNGASITAVEGGRSVDTSMGLTPLEGLVMGSRSGDIDPSAVFHLVREAGMGIDEIDDLLNRRSGMLGLTGMQDMRDVAEAVAAGDEAAIAAMDLYCYRLRKYIGAYTAVLGRVDAVVFTAGVGENSSEVREQVMAPLGHLGMGIDVAGNAERAGGVRDLSAPEAIVRTLVVPTNEEWEIARQAVEVIVNPQSHERHDVHA